MKKQHELIANCEDEHDRKLMIKALDKHNKFMRKAYTILGIGLFIFILSLGLLKAGFDWAAVGFCVAPFFPIWIIIIILKESGLN